MLKIASYQEGAVSPAGICGSDMTNEVIFDMETMINMCPPLADRNKPIMSYASDLMGIAEMEKTASNDWNESRGWKPNRYTNKK